MKWRWWQKNPDSFFSQKEEKDIIATIQEAENTTSSEIRVHLEDHCEDLDVYDRGWQVFHELEMGQTDLRNGVLIYMAVKDHKFALIADAGIDEKVSEGYWDELVRKMASDFKQGKFKDGIIEAIQEVSQKLKTYFPRTEGDKNELSDDISYGTSSK